MAPPGLSAEPARRGSWLWGSSGNISLQGEVRALTPSCLDRICEPPMQTSSQAGRKLRKPLSFLSPCGLFQTPVGNKSPSKGKKPLHLGTLMQTRFPRRDSSRLYQCAEFKRNHSPFPISTCRIQKKSFSFPSERCGRGKQRPTGSAPGVPSYLLHSSEILRILRIPINKGSRLQVNWDYLDWLVFIR